MGSRRKRLPNFSHGEEIILRTIAVKYQREIEEVSHSRSWKVKSSTWNKIAADFLSKTGIPRPGAKLKSKYDAMKKNELVKPPLVKEEDNENVENFINEPTLKFKIEAAKQDEEIVESTDTGNNSQAQSLTPNREDLDELLPLAEQNTNIQIKVIPTQNLKTQALVTDRDQNMPKDEETPQMTYYRNQDIRAQQKHGLELKNLAIQQVLLETELRIKKAELRRCYEGQNNGVNGGRKQNTHIFTTMDNDISMQVDNIVENSNNQFNIAENNEDSLDYNSE